MFNYIINFFYPPESEEKTNIKKPIKKLKKITKKKESNLPPDLLEEIIEKKKNLRKVTPKPPYIREDPIAAFLKNLRKQINGED